VVASQTAWQGPPAIIRVPTLAKVLFGPHLVPPSIQQVISFVSVGNERLLRNLDHSDSSPSILRPAPARWLCSHTMPHENAPMPNLAYGPLPLPNKPHFCRWKVRVSVISSMPTSWGGDWWSDRPTIRLSRITFVGGAALLGLTGLHSLSERRATNDRYRYSDESLAGKITISPSSRHRWPHSLWPQLQRHTHAVDVANRPDSHPNHPLHCPSFRTPTLAANHIFVGTMNSVYAITAS